MIKWFDRSFDFAHNFHDLSVLQMRLAGFPAKLVTGTNGLGEALLTSGEWSVKADIGHLADLEPLWQGRLDDILYGERELRASDLLNTKTDPAGHNDQSLADLLVNFRNLRGQTIGLQDLLRRKFLLNPLYIRF